VCETLIFLVVLTACGASSNPTPTSLAQTATEALAEATVSTDETEEILLVTGEFPPLTSESIEGGGLSVEIIRAVFAEMGRPMRIEFFPWERAEAMVENGEAWGAFPYVPSPERSERFLISNPFSQGRTSFFYYDDALSTFEYEDLTELAQYTIGVSLGYWYIEPLEQAGLQTEEASDDVANLRKLQAGRIDLFPIYEPIGLWLIQNNFSEDAENFRILEQAMSVDNDTVIVSRVYPGSDLILAEFNGALETVQDSDVYRKIFERYGLNPISINAAGNE
jgi:polar amino acid transport system substrate-binding protein